MGGCSWNLNEKEILGLIFKQDDSLLYPQFMEISYEKTLEIIDEFRQDNGGYPWCIFNREEVCNIIKNYSQLFTLKQSPDKHDFIIAINRGCFEKGDLLDKFLAKFGAPTSSDRLYMMAFQEKALEKVNYRRDTVRKDGLLQGLYVYGEKKLAEVKRADEISAKKGLQL